MPYYLNCSFLSWTYELLFFFFNRFGKTKSIIPGTLQSPRSFLLLLFFFFTFSPVQLSHSVVSDSLRPHESQHTRPLCPSPTPRVHSNSCPLSQWCHPAISSSVVPFSSRPQSLPASRSFPISQLFTWGGQSTGVSALPSVLSMNTQDWSPCSPRDSQESFLH